MLIFYYSRNNFFMNCFLFAYFSSGSLLNSFQPVYPDRLWMDEKAFCNEFPFHIVFDKEVKAKLFFFFLSRLGEYCANAII